MTLFGLFDLAIVSTVLTVVFIGLPRLFFDRPQMATGRTDRLIIDFVRMAALIVTLTFVFVPTHLFQLAAFAMLGIASAYLVRLRPRGLTIIAVMARWARVGDASLYIIEAGSADGNEAVQRTVNEWWHEDVRPAMRPKMPRLPSLKQVAYWSPLAAITSAVLGSALWWPLTHVSLRTGDAYVHLSWTKRLAEGQLFSDGVSPRGMHGLVGFAQDVGPASTFDVFRFGGPILAAATALLTYAVCARAVRGHAAQHAIGVAGAAVYAGLMWGSDFSGLAGLNTLSPIDIALFFGLASAYLAIEWLENPTAHRLLAMAGGLYVTATVDPAGLTIGLSAALAAGFALSATRGTPASALRVVATSVSAIALGSAFWLARFLPGIGDYNGSDQLNPLSGEASSAFAPSLSAATLGALGALAVVGAAFAIRSRQTLPDTERPTALPDTELVALSTGSAAGSQRRRIRPVWAAALAAMSIAPTFAIVGPAAARSETLPIEYESAARALDGIIRQHTTLSYTVVGPPAWEDRAQANGFHVQLTDFVDRLTLRNASDPSFTIPLFTDRVFVMAEKRPFDVQGDHYLNSVVGERYYQAGSRAQLMADVIEFMETYTRSHPDAVTVSFEDDDVIVWAIRQRADQEYALRYGLADPQFAPDCGPVAECR